ncbi:MAG: hypothetical protein QM759_08525 [Terricaulis sp.]
MLYVAIVVLTMLVLPVGSIALEHPADTATLIGLIGKWFVFWSVGVRLGLAGVRQCLQARFTAREIFHMQTDEALPLVRELGVANIAIGAVGLAVLMAPSFILPAAIYASIFYAFAGFMHIQARQRSFNETLAMVSDVFMALVLAAYVAATLQY